LLGAAALACALLPSPATARGLGDPFFPNAGNRGYDVLHYDVALSYAPGSGKLRRRQVANRAGGAAADADRVSHRRPIPRPTASGDRPKLDPLFEDWLYRPGKPAGYG
jgi:hypothetical protein